MSRTKVWISVPPLDDGIRRMMKQRKLTLAEVRRHLRALAVHYLFHAVDVAVRRQPTWHPPRWSTLRSYSQEKAIERAVTDTIIWLTVETMRDAAAGKLRMRGRTKR